MAKIAVIGAGKTGRGFVARLLSESGAEILFVDKDAALVETLNRAGSFTVRFFGDARPPVTVSGYTAATWENADFSGVELVFTAVGGSNLREAAGELAKRCRGAAVITCENAVSPAKTFAKAAGEGFAVAEAAVFCTTTEAGGGSPDILSEDYSRLPYDGEALPGFSPGLAGVEPVPRFEDFLRRKLYTYNCLSCVIAYTGAYYGFSDYADAANDPRVTALCSSAVAGINAALCREYGYGEEDQAEFAAAALRKFRNRAITDSVERNARDPERKLARDERIAGPLRLMEKYGEDPTALEITAAATLLYSGDPAWEAYKSSHAPEEVLREVAGIDPGEPTGGRIMSHYRKMLRERGAGSTKNSLYGMAEVARRRQSLCGLWDYRVANGPRQKREVPFSARPVGVSTAALTFRKVFRGERVFLVFDGITYAATVRLNGASLGEMLPYSEYRFDVTDVLQEEGNRLEAELRDIDPVFGPSNGWENYGGIIREVYLEYTAAARFEDVAWSATLRDGYTAASAKVETECAGGERVLVTLASPDGAPVGSYEGEPGALEFPVDRPALWSPDSPALYTFRVALVSGGEVTDAREMRVGFKEFVARGKRFYLNGEPLFLLGVNRHDLYGDKGHTLTYEETLRDMKMIKSAGVNYVRLVHYPHHKRVLELADELGLLVSEEPGLWWSDMHNPEICEAALEVLRRVIKRDRSHVSVAFWLSFNECVFTLEYLRESAKVCRAADPTRMVSGANCMDLEMTKENYPRSGFDFYTMHPYAPTTELLLKSAETLTEMPLLLTEWGGYYVAGNERLFREFIRTIVKLSRNPEDGPVLAGATFWCWAEYDEYRRANAVEDGVVREGLVDKYRVPTDNLKIFTEEFAALKLPPEPPCYEIEFTAALPYEEGAFPLDLAGASDAAAPAFSRMTASAPELDGRGRERRAATGPVLPEDVYALGGLPVNLCRRPVVAERETVIPVGRAAAGVYVFGNVSYPGGFPLGGEYGEPAGELAVRYSDGSEDRYVLRNGVDISAADTLLGTTRIDPRAENTAPALLYCYDRDFERYTLAARRFPADPAKTVDSLAFSSAPGYNVLIYGVTVAG